MVDGSGHVRPVFNNRYKVASWVRLPILAGSVPTRLLLRISIDLTRPADTVTPNRELTSGEVSQLVLLVQLPPAVAVYRSHRASQSDCGTVSDALRQIGYALPLAVPACVLVLLALDVSVVVVSEMTNELV